MNAFINNYKQQLNPTGKCKNVYIALVLLAFSVIVWNGFIYLYKGTDFASHDPLNQTVFEWNTFEKCCSWWPLLHLFWFTVFSFIFPNCSALLFTGGVVWELIEVLLGILYVNNKKENLDTKKSKLQYNIWWSGSVKDILFNTIGIILGRLLRYLLIKN
jgi:hypothetical protein